jgi:chromosome segregation ATPase
MPYSEPLFELCNKVIENFDSETSRREAVKKKLNQVSEKTNKLQEKIEKTSEYFNLTTASVDDVVAAIKSKNIDSSTVKEYFKQYLKQLSKAATEFASLQIELTNIGDPIGIISAMEEAITQAIKATSSASAKEPESKDIDDKLDGELIDISSVSEDESESAEWYCANLEIARIRVTYMQKEIDDILDRCEENQEAVNSHMEILQARIELLQEAINQYQEKDASAQRLSMR